MRRSFNFAIIFFIIIKINILFVSSELMSVQKNDNFRLWRRGSIINFNSLYAITIKEEYLSSDGYCSGKCDITPMYQSSAQNLPYPNQCPGLLRYCWIKNETNARKEAKKNYDNFSYDHINTEILMSRDDEEEIAEANKKLDHNCNICECYCHRLYNSAVSSFRGELLNSICFDPVSVDDGYVATGVRFKRYNSTIYLELQQGKLENGEIDPLTVKWKIYNECEKPKNVIYNFSGPYYDGLKIILEDMTFSEDTVVTGVKLGESLTGRHVDAEGNINTNEPEMTKLTQCTESTHDLVHGYPDLLPSTLLMGTNVELSKSCKHHILFGGTSEVSDDIQHVVPFVDLQEIVTDPPEVIHGVGWYYRGHPGFGGFLALKIFKKKNF